MDEYFDKVLEVVDLTQYKPLNQIVYEGLRTAIIKGIIPVGERINEKEYAQRLNISRTPIREALRRIEEEQLVEYIPRFGTIVKKITAADVEEVFKIRVVLEILATTNAMNEMSEQQFEEMENLLDRTDEANEAQDIRKVIVLSEEFNRMQFRFSNMPRLESILLKLKDYLSRFRDISLSDEQRRNRALTEHRFIFRSMKNHQVEQVEMIIREHLASSRTFILEQVKARENAE